MLRISLVSYLNTKPFLEGLNQEFNSAELKLFLRSPAKCAESLLDEEVDLALIPVGSVVDFDRLKILKDFCIGADGPVDSVFLFSQVPLDKIKRVILDPHSRTSNGLTQVLIKEKGYEVEFIRTRSRNFSKIKGKTAGVTIGDAAFRLQKNYKYVYDLSEEWKKLTGLPFVFAVWAARPGSISEGMKIRLDRAFKLGMQKKEFCAQKYGPEFGYSEAEAFKYLTDSIDFNFTREKHEALRVYFRELLKLEPLKTEITLDGALNEQ